MVGIMLMLESTSVDLSGKHCVIVGRSDIVGKPMALLMLGKNATVTICHSYTEDLAAEVLFARSSFCHIVSSTMSFA